MENQQRTSLLGVRNVLRADPLDPTLELFAAAVAP